MFDRRRSVLERDPAGLEVHSDPTALAPERLLVFEVTGSIQNFARAAARVPGLEFEGEEDMAPTRGLYCVRIKSEDDLSRTRVDSARWESVQGRRGAALIRR